jgi:nitrate reductase NapE component
MIQDRSQTRRDVAQSGSALGWGPSGRRFKSGRPDFSRRATVASVERRELDTIYLLLGIIGFFLIIAIFFFGGFVLLDFLWGRRGGDV